MKELYKKLFDLKSEIGKISKNQENPFYKSKYFDINSLLEHLEPILKKNNVLLLQPITHNMVGSMLIDPDTGQSITSEIELPAITDPQKLGSAVTYYRRYTLQSLLGLQAEDDDGNIASKAEQAQVTDNKEWFNIGSKAWNKALDKCLHLDEVRKYYKVSKANAEKYNQELNIKLDNIQ